MSYTKDKDRSKEDKEIKDGTSFTINKDKVRKWLIWILVFTVIAYFTPPVITYFKCRLTAEDAMIKDYAELPVVKKDGWGNSLVYNRHAEETAVLYIVTSAGRDQELYTNDDIEWTAVDFNKARIIGKWAGKRTKEAFKGVVDGLKHETKFKKEDK
jgi:hypothetical protein